MIYIYIYYLLVNIVLFFLVTPGYRTVMETMVHGKPKKWFLFDLMIFHGFPSSWNLRDSWLLQRISIRVNQLMKGRLWKTFGYANSRAGIYELYWIIWIICRFPEMGLPLKIAGWFISWKIPMGGTSMTKRKPRYISRWRSDRSDEPTTHWWRFWTPAQAENPNHRLKWYCYLWSYKCIYTYIYIYSNLSK